MTGLRSLCGATQKTNEGRAQVGILRTLCSTRGVHRNQAFLVRMQLRWRIYVALSLGLKFVHRMQLSKVPCNRWHLQVVSLAGSIVAESLTSFGLVRVAPLSLFCNARWALWALYPGQALRVQSQGGSQGRGCVDSHMFPYVLRLLMLEADGERFDADARSSLEAWRTER